jgi:anti-sigma regulatory factor (Ser/Thr protein kinase)
MADHYVRDSLLLDGPLWERPGDARRWVIAHCAEANLALNGNDLPLLVSELVTNACVHGADPITIRLDTSPTRVRVEVEDNSPDELPRVRRPTARDTQGRGLLIVESLSHLWGTERTPTGKVVWAEVPVRADGTNAQHRVGSA